MTAPKMFAVSGRKNAGKTSWVCLLLAALREDGLRAGSIKHTHHRHDVPGKDSDRHQGAGAQRTLLVSPHGLAVYEPWTRELTLSELVESHFDGFDVVIVEGYRGVDMPRIIVGEDDSGSTPDNIIALAPCIAVEAPQAELQRVLGAVRSFLQAAEPSS